MPEQDEAQQSQQIHEDEIDLRELINVVLKRKKLILGIFLASVIVTAIMSFLTPKVYEASVSLMIVPSRARAILSPTHISLDIMQHQQLSQEGQQIYMPAISIPTHKELLTSNLVLQEIIDNLKLADRSGSALTPANLFSKISITETKDTNILQLHVKDANPKTAQRIANAWAEEYVKYSQEFISGEARGKGEFIFDQFKVAKENLIQSEKHAKDFKNKYKLDLMRAELDMKKSKLNEYKKELIDLEIALKTKESNFAELKEQIANQSKFIIVSKAITDDALWQKSQKDLSGLNERKLRSEEINPIYRDLETRIVNTEIDLNTLKAKADYIRKAQAGIEIEIDKLSESISQKDFEFIQLERQMSIYKRTYDNLASKIEDVRIIKAAQLGETRLISPALEPTSPTGPNKKLNITIAGMLSLMLGMFLAFFMEFWQKSKVDIKKD
jgi:polysaccharide biosynthesis transport protein